MTATLRTLAGDLTLRGSADVEVSGVTADSRRVRPGWAFVAVRGVDADGARFAPDAVAAGAVAVVVEPGTDVEVADPVARVEVDDAREAIARFSRALHGHPDRGLRVAAVTGTNGKTSVAHLTRDLLAGTGHPCGLLGTIAVDTGPRREPSSLTTPGPEDLYAYLGEMVEADRVAVSMEASSHALEQGRLGDLEVDAAGFTNLTRDHLDYHSDADAYLAAKLRLLERLEAPGRTKPAGRAVVYHDDPVFGSRTWPEGTIRVGAGAECEVRLREHGSTREGLRLDLEIEGRPVRAATRLWGEYNVANLLVAIGMGRALGLSAEAIEAALPALQPVPGRLEPVPLDGGPLCLVDYAHTPDGIRSALAACRPLTGGRITVVFGCGGDRDRGKRPLMARAAAAGADQVILTLDNPRGEDPARIFADTEAGFTAADSHRTVADRQEAIDVAVAGSGPQDLVLVAGKGHETYQILADGRVHWDDRDALRRAWARVGEASS